MINACRNLQIDKAEQEEIFNVSIQGSFYQKLLKYCKQKSIENYQVHYAVSSHNVLSDITTRKVDYGVVALNNSQRRLVVETIDALSLHKNLIIDSIIV